MVPVGGLAVWLTGRLLRACLMEIRRRRTVRRYDLDRMWIWSKHRAAPHVPFDVWLKKLPDGELKALYEYAP